MGTTKSKTQQQQNDTQLLAGLQSNEGTLPASWNLTGVAYTLVQIVAILTTRVAKMAAVAAAKAKYASAVLAAEQEVASTKPVVDAVRQQLRVWCANAPDVLATYGLTVAKPKAGVRSPVNKVLAAAKGSTTRAARGTKSKAEKELIVGTVPPAISISTQTEKVSLEGTAAPQASAAPASAPSAAGTGHTPSGS